FINCARPGILALLLLRILDILKPWRMTGGTSTRDNWRVCAISVFFPWISWRWRAAAAQLAAKHANQELKNALAERGEQPLIILTSGFGSVVRPLLQAMGLGDVPLVASRMFTPTDRRHGKLRMATRELGAE